MIYLLKDIVLFTHFRLDWKIGRFYWSYFPLIQKVLLFMESFIKTYIFPKICTTLYCYQYFFPIRLASGFVHNLKNLQIIR